MDASALAAFLSGPPADQDFVRDAITEHDIWAPELMPFETANVLRRLSIAGLITSAEAGQAHADLLRMPVTLVPYAALATRAWELRHDLSSYDAAYVALAETLDSGMVSLDERLSRAPGLRCTVLTPP